MRATLPSSIVSMTCTGSGFGIDLRDLSRDSLLNPTTEEGKIEIEKMLQRAVEKKNAAEQPEQDKKEEEDEKTQPTEQPEQPPEEADEKKKH